MFHQQSPLELIGECALSGTNIFSILILTEGNCWDGIHERSFSSGKYKEMGTLNRSLDGNKANGICKSTEETPFCRLFMGHKYYEICVMFVILMGHILAVKDGV
jgi:hypothetical protein